MIQAGFLCNTGSSKSFQLSHAIGTHKKKKMVMKKKKKKKKKKKGKKKRPLTLGFWLQRKILSYNRWLGGFKRRPRVGMNSVGNAEWDKRHTRTVCQTVSSSPHHLTTTRYRSSWLNDVTKTTGENRDAGMFHERMRLKGERKNTRIKD